MKRILLAFVLAAALLPAARHAHANDDYNLGPDSMRQPDVPQGEVTHFTFTSTKIYPGTQRDVAVYVPKQYDAAKPACVMFFQDGGGGLNVPIVFDNLINKKEMPVTVAIMLTPGVVPAASANALPRFNRSHEYDATNDQYARFLIEEILPEVSKKLNLSTNPDDLGLCGSSSGGIASFTAAWERPDQFHRVITFIGSFTNLQGGHAYPSLIRKYEPRPIRVFQQDGSNDQDIYSGNWFIGNNDVAAALRFGGYDCKYIVGDGGHSGRQGASILPDALRWLWRDYPKPVGLPTSTPQPVFETLQPGETWQAVGGKMDSIGGLAADADGTIYCSDAGANRILALNGDGSVKTLHERVKGVTGLAVGPDGRIYACQPSEKRIITWDASGKETVIASGVSANQLTVNHKGEVYFTDTAAGKVGWIDAARKKHWASEAVPGAVGVALTPDQTLLLVTQNTPDKFAWSYSLRPDGTPSDLQSFFDVHTPFGDGLSGAEGMTTDTQGRLYIASKAGVQVCDQAGRVIGILSNPDRLPTRLVAFGGANFDVLYAVANNTLYRRKMRGKGVLSFQEPIKPPAPRL